MKKILFAANKDTMILNMYLPYIKFFKEQNYEIHVMTNSEAKIPFSDKKIKIEYESMRKPISKRKLIQKVRKIIQTETYERIITTTLEANTLIRMSVRKHLKEQTKITCIIDKFPFYIYSNKFTYQHYFRLEKKLANYTDELFFLNQDDYKIAKKNFKKIKKIYYTPGLGIDLSLYEQESKKEEQAKLRQTLNIKAHDFVLLYEGDLTKENRQDWLIEALSDLFINNENFHLLLLGSDELHGKCQEMASEMGLTKQIHFLGYRTDEIEWMHIAHVALNASLDQGFPLNILKAICIGLPIIAVETRGVKDLVITNENGFLIDDKDAGELCSRITQIYLDTALRKKMITYNLSKRKEYALETIEPQILQQIKD